VIADNGPGMQSERFAVIGVSLGLAAVGALAWWLQLQPARVVDAAALDTLPQHIGAWRAREIPLDQTVESVLRADFNLQRAYVHPTGELIWIYVGYYGTARGGRPEHTPRGCYTGAGWGIAEARTVDLTPDGSLRANEYVVERGQQRRLVHFWYRSHRRSGILGGLDQNIDRLLGRLLDGRADGALIRVSTPIEAGDAHLARSRLLSFASTLDALLAERWPTETPVS
jgi:EpsI family protein